MSRFENFSDAELLVIHTVTGQIGGTHPARDITDHIHEEVEREISIRMGGDALRYASMIAARHRAGFGVSGTLVFTEIQPELASFQF